MRRLPAWAEHAGFGSRGLPRVNVDADLMYPAMLAALGVEKPDRFWLETAYQCMKLDLQAAMGFFGFEIRVNDRHKSWAQGRFPNGLGAAQATFGREARNIYIEMRRGIPT